jgi:cobalt-precorrin 5A hydrolase
MVVAGIGCRAGVTAEQVAAALDAALGTAVRTSVLTIDAIATPVSKGDESGINAVASARGVPLMLIHQDALEAANARTLTRSAHSLNAMNVNSVAETAALAGAGEDASLLGPRVAVGPVTCALATAPLSKGPVSP